jgi:predicted GNAT family acetyltransferase
VRDVTKEFLHEEDANRYVLRIDSQLVAIVDYRINGNAISFTRTFTTPAHRGKGLAAEITDFAATDVETTSTRRIVPMCWYTGEWFEKHPERSALLSR